MGLTGCKYYKNGRCTDQIFYTECDLDIFNGKCSNGEPSYEEFNTDEVW
jgi:hypothetical protein